MTKAKPAIAVDAAPTIPTAKFTLGGNEYSIEFNLDHLLKIEEAAKLPIMKLAEEHLDQLAVRDAEGNPVKEPTDEQSSERFKSVPATRMRALVAACIPMPVETVPMVGLGNAFIRLATTLSQAVNQVMGAGDEDEDEDAVPQRPTAASGS
jgi:hypothetical protein